MKDQHDTTPPSSSHSQDVDIAATTLLPSASSSKTQSFEDARRTYADIELEEWERKRRKRDGERDGGYGSDEDDVLAGAEGERLLADETATLNDSRAAETARDIDGEQDPPPAPRSAKEEPVTWMSLPKKSQLAILTLARASEPLTQQSLAAYVYYQLKSFHPSDAAPPSDATVAQQAGLLAAVFTGAQFLTAIMWGRLADSERFGRKTVIMIGLLGSAVGTLGFGFSKSFAWAVFWRIVAGILNGNMGVMRTMISEIVKEKKFQSRAFMLMPMTFNVGVIIGPLLGGWLADPVGSHPELFGPKYDGWMKTWPYALPNVVNSSFLFFSAILVIFGMEETLEGLKDRPDAALRCSRRIGRLFTRRRAGPDYTALGVPEAGDEDVELMAGTEERKASPRIRIRRKLPFNRIWTSNVCFTLISHGLLAMHIGTFNNLWFVFLSTPRYTPGSSNNDGDSKTLHLPEGYKPHLPFEFTGGLALPPPSIGTALAILGVIGLTLQLLFYPRVSFRLGTLTSFRYSLLLCPIAYTLAPYLSVLPSSNPPPEQASGAFVWIGITVVLTFQVLARTFALPSTAILVNNASPHPSVLGTMHGIAQTVSSATRTVGPALMGWVYGVGLGKGVVGLAWWCIAGIAVLGCIAGTFVREGDGHEIWLEGEKEEVEMDKG